jgi:hypothetical protein
LVINWLMANGLVAPLTGSSAPTPVDFWPLSESNRPAATTCVPPPVTTRAMTSVLVRALCAVFFVPGMAFPCASKNGSELPAVEPTPGTGAQGSSAPFDADTAARLVRLVAPTAVMLPPR